MKNNSQNWKTIKSKSLINNPWCKIIKEKVLLPNGIVINDYYINQMPSVAIIAPITKDNNIVMVKQYRHGAKKVLLELPAGTFDIKKEKPEKVAKRELLEETGYSASNLIKLGVFYEYPTKDRHNVHAFLSKNLKRDKEPNPEPTENIEVLEVPIGKILKLITNGEIEVSGTIATLFLSLYHLNKH